MSPLLVSLVTYLTPLVPRNQFHNYYVHGEFAPCDIEWDELYLCFALKFEKNNIAEVCSMLLSISQPQCVCAVSPFPPTSPSFFTLQEKWKAQMAKRDAMKPVSVFGTVFEPRIGVPPGMAAGYLSLLKNAQDGAIPGKTRRKTAALVLCSWFIWNTMGTASSERKKMTAPVSQTLNRTRV